METLPLLLLGLALLALFTWLAIRWSKARRKPSGPYYEIRIDGDKVINAGMPSLVNGRRAFNIEGFEPETMHSFEVRMVSASGHPSPWVGKIHETTLPE
jgi:hypothetical protein